MSSSEFAFAGGDQAHTGHQSDRSLGAGALDPSFPKSITSDSVGVTSSRDFPTMPTVPRGVLHILTQGATVAVAGAPSVRAICLLPGTDEPQLQGPVLSTIPSPGARLTPGAWYLYTRICTQEHKQGPTPQPPETCMPGTGLSGESMLFHLVRQVLLNTHCGPEYTQVLCRNKG